MEINNLTKQSFSVIGRLGSTDEGDGFVQRLWQEANQHFSEVAGLAKKDGNGNIAGFWGAMSDLSERFMPWEDHFSKGLYLAGVETEDNAEPPEGWTKWTLPASEYLVVKSEGSDTFVTMIDYMDSNQIELVGAVYDFSDPQNGQGYMYFPIKRI